MKMIDMMITTINIIIMMITIITTMMIIIVIVKRDWGHKVNLALARCLQCKTCKNTIYILIIIIIIITTIIVILLILLLLLIIIIINNIAIMNNIFNIIFPIFMALTVNFNRVVSLLAVMVKEKACLPALEEDPEF